MQETRVENSRAPRSLTPFYWIMDPTPFYWIMDPKPSNYQI